MKPLKLEELSTEQKIGQLLVVRGYLDEQDKKEVYEMLKEKCVGGVQVNYYPGCEEEIKRIKEAAGYPVLICGDMETGFPGSEYKIPAMLALATANDLELAYQVGAASAIEAKACGFNTVWGPNVDMVDYPGSRVLRSWGNDPKLVSDLAAAVLRGYIDNGMFATMKHWPGGRDSWVDTHMKEGISNLTEEELLETDIKPYLAGMKEGLFGVMTRHTVVAPIDDKYPTSLSEKVISVLRKQGFDGLITTDSFAMMGILQKYNEEKCYGMAVKAGNDMILPNYRVSYKTSYNYLLNSYKEGAFSEERLNEAVRRVLKSQEIASAPAKFTELSDYHRECMGRVARESITAITDGTCPVTLSENTKKLFVIISENMYEGVIDNGKEITDRNVFDKKNIPAIKESILKRFPGSEIGVINQYPNPAQVEDICFRATKADEVIYLTYHPTGSYLASENITEKVIRLMESMENKIAAIVHMGSPYALRYAPHSPRVILSFGRARESMEYSMAILKGEIKPKGKLPINPELK